MFRVFSKQTWFSWPLASSFTTYNHGITYLIWHKPFFHKNWVSYKWWRRPFFRTHIHLLYSIIHWNGKVGKFILHKIFFQMSILWSEKTSQISLIFCHHLLREWSIPVVRQWSRTVVTLLYIIPLSHNSGHIKLKKNYISFPGSMVFFTNTYVNKLWRFKRYNPWTSVRFARSLERDEKGYGQKQLRRWDYIFFYKSDILSYFKMFKGKRGLYTWQLQQGRSSSLREKSNPELRFEITGRNRWHLF